MVSENHFSSKSENRIAILDEWLTYSATWVSLSFGVLTVESHIYGAGWLYIFCGMFMIVFSIVHIIIS